MSLEQYLAGISRTDLISLSLKLTNHSIAELQVKTRLTVIHFFCATLLNPTACIVLKFQVYFDFLFS